MFPTRRTRKVAIVTADKTLTAADSGILQRVTVDGVVLTIPSTALGLHFAFQNGGKNDGEVGFSINPQTADGVTGNGLTAAANKDVINTKATARVDDEIHLFGTGAAGVTAYVVAQPVVGVFERQA